MTLNIFKLHKELTEALTTNAGLVKQIEGLDNEVNNLKTMSKDVMETQAAHNEVITKLKEENAIAIEALKNDHIKAFEKLNADYKAQIEALTVKANTEAVSAEEKAIKIVANLGVPVEEIPTAAVVDEPAVILANLKTMSPSQLSEYFNKNQKLVFEALKKSAKNKK